MARYKFIGEDGSMGYKTGKVYYGTIETCTSMNEVDGTVIFIPGVFPFNIFSRKMVIPYESIHTFHNNWIAE